MTLCLFDDTELELQASRAKAKKPNVSKPPGDSGVGYAKPDYHSQTAATSGGIGKADDSDDPDDLEDAMLATLVLLNGLLPELSSISPPPSTQDE